MKKIFLILIFVQFLWGSIDGVIDRYFKAVESEDFNTISQILYNPQEVASYKAILSAIEQKISNLNIKSVKKYGDKAIVKVNVEAVIKNKKSFESFNENVDLIFLMQKSGGIWKVRKVIPSDSFDLIKKAAFLETIKKQLLSSSANTTKKEQNYLGCYKDKGDPFGLEGRDLNGLFKNSKDMNVKMCINLCREKGFKYAGVEYGTWCFCGNSYGKYGKSNKCKMPCSGNEKEMCGGYWAISVYDTTKENLIYNSADSGENFLNNQKVISYFRDNFNTFNPNVWEVYEWQTLKPARDKLIITNGILDLKCNYTDRSAFVVSKPIPIQKGEILTIKRRVKVHYANRYFEGGVWVYQTDGNSVVMPQRESAWLSAFGSNLFYLTYFNYYYQKPGIKQYVPTQHGFALYGMNWKKDKNYKVLEPVWDRWFTEEIIYNSAKNEVIYKLNGKSVKVKTAPLTKPYIRFIMHSYGWFTGHDVKVDWVEVTVKKSINDSFNSKENPLNKAYIGNCVISNNPYSKVTTNLSPFNKKIYLTCKTHNLKKGDKVDLQLFYLKDGNRYRIYMLSLITKESKKEDFFNLNIWLKEQDKWPSGDYEVEFFINGKFSKKIKFQIH